MIFFCGAHYGNSYYNVGNSENYRFDILKLVCSFRIEFELKPSIA